MSLALRMSETEAMKIAYITYNGPYAKCCHTYADLMKLFENHLSNYKILGYTRDKPNTPPEKQSFKCALQVPFNFDESLVPNVQYETIPGCQCLVVRHVGPYDQICKAYKLGFSSLIKKNLRYAYPQIIYEHYVNNPQKVKSQDELQTDLYIPVKKLISPTILLCISVIIGASIFGIKKLW